MEDELTGSGLEEEEPVDLPAPINTRSALEASRNEAQEEADPAQPEPSATFGEAYKAAVRQNQISHTSERAAQFSREVDPNWSLDADRLQEDMKAMGFEEMPDGWISELAVQRNENDYLTKLGHMKQRVKDKEVIDSLGGWRAVGAQFAAYGTDPIAAAVDIFSGGFGRGATTLGRVANGAFRGGAAHGIVEGILAADGDIPDPAATASGFAAAMILGGVGGGLMGQATEAGEPLARTMNAINDDTVPDVKIAGRFDDSVGAARNPLMPDPIPGVDMEASKVIRYALDDLYPESGRPVTILNKVKFDSSAQTQRGTNELTKKMGDLFVPDSSSTRGQLGVLEMTDKFRGRLDAPWQRGMTDAFLSHQKNQAGKGWIRSMYDATGRDDFAERAGKYIFTEGATESTPEIQQVAKVWGDMAVDALHMLQRAGVRGVNHLKENKWYMPRMKAPTKINRIASDIPDAERALAALVEESMIRAAARNAGEEAVELTEEMRNVFRTSSQGYAKWLMRRQDSAMEDIDNLDLDLGRVETFSDLKEFLSRNLSDDPDAMKEASDMLARIDPETSDDVDLMRSLFHSTDPNEAPDRLKFRMSLDHATEIDWNGRTLRMTDLYETNMDKVAFNYQRWAAGEAALAQLTDGKVTSKTLKAAVEETKEAVAHTEGGRFAGAPTEKDARLMDFMYRSTMGLKMDDMSDNVRRSLALVRNASYVSRMGMAWTHTFGESMAMMAMAGPGRFIRNMPALRQISREIRGKGGEGLAKDIQMFTNGLGKSLTRNMGQLRYELDDATRGAGLFQKAEDFMEGTKRLATVGNLLSHSTDMMRDYSAVLALRQLDDFLVGGKKMPKWFRKRANTWTLTPEREQLIGDYLRKNAVRDKNGVITRLKEGTADQHQAMEDYMYRYVSEAVQHLNAGNLPSQMQNPLMKLIFQFRSWEMGSWHRHTLKDIGMRDRVAASKFMSSALVASLAYVGRSYWTSAGNQEDLDRDLTTERIVASGVGYSVNAGILPAVIDSISSTVGTGPVIRPVRTSGIASGLGLDGFAATKLYDDWEDFIKLPFRQARHLATEGSLDSLTRSEARSLFAVAFMDTMWFARPAKEWFMDQHETASEKANDNTLGLE